MPGLAARRWPVAWSTGRDDLVPLPGQPHGRVRGGPCAGPVVDTRHYARDDQIEITGTEGVFWVTRGHGRAGRPAAHDPLPGR
jgi:hypothetical protein